jgi:hypothetical protein
MQHEARPATRIPRSHSIDAAQYATPPRHVKEALCRSPDPSGVICGGVVNSINNVCVITLTVTVPVTS